MKTKLFTLAAALGFTMGVVAQNSVSVDAGAAWLGYANIFDPATGDFVFGEPWGVPDIKTVVDAGGRDFNPSAKLQHLCGTTQQILSG